MSGSPHDTAPVAPDAPIVATDRGRISGRRRGGVEQFIEIPYAAPPVGPRRFKVPQPVVAWEGVRPADSWRNRAPQPPDPSYARAPRVFYAMHGDFYAPQLSEDCLTVNVWTPSTTDGERRPVLFWIHGGAFTYGHAASDAYDGENFAREHDVVFVSVTHRLNAFGFLQLERLGGPEYAGSGNAGMLDLVAALEWVQRNIEAFGGDPDIVTIVGESGGGAKVSMLLVMSLEQQLFHRAVCQSGVALTAGTPEESEAYARALIAELGGTDVSALVTASMPDLIEAQRRIERADPGLAGPRPVIDGRVLPKRPVDVWKAGGGSGVPVLAGWTRDELSVFAPGDVDLDIEIPESFAADSGAAGADRAPGDVPPAGLAGLAWFTGGQDVDSVIAARRASHPSESDDEIAQRLAGEIIFMRPAITLAESRRVWGKTTFLYRLDWASPRIAPRGAPHSSDIGLFFGNGDRLLFTRGLASARSVSTAMSTALAAFLRSGDPGAGNGSAWAAYEPADRAVMIFDEHCRIELDPERAVRLALDEIDPQPLM